jgi:5'-3' exonuclease
VPRCKTLVIDGKNLTVRSFFAYPGTLSADGHTTNLLHGSFLELFKHVKMFQPATTIVTWDSKSVFRREVYAGYKAGKRGTMTDVQFASFTVQHQIFEEGLTALGVCQMKVEGVEGDDLVAFTVIIPENRPAVIISTDRDFWQLVRGDQVTLYDPRKKTLLAGSSFSMATGFDSPEHHLAFKVLKGDKGDGVPPAVIRMGEKKAIEMAKTFKLPRLDGDSLRYGPTEYFAVTLGDDDLGGRCSRNYQLVSLHYAVMEQMTKLAPLREAVVPKPNWKRFLTFCQKYKLEMVAKAYGEVDRLI